MFDKWVYPHLEKLLSRVNKDEEKEMLENNNDNALLGILNED